MVARSTTILWVWVMAMAGRSSGVLLLARPLVPVRWAAPEALSRVISSAGLGVTRVTVLKLAAEMDWTPA